QDLALANLDLRDSIMDTPQRGTYTDPVCGMEVKGDLSRSAMHEGTTYYFCGRKCLDKFNANPQQYAHRHERAHQPPPAPTAPVKGQEDVIYTCPMHPQIRKRGPGNCPICGMALEPLVATGAEDTSELRDMTRRFWVSLVLTAPLLLLTMGEFIPG